MVVFKKATIENIPNIQLIAHHTWPDTFADVMPKKQVDFMLNWMYSEESLKKQMLSQQHHFVLIYVDNKIAGFTSYEFNYRQTPQLMIHKAYILPALQGHGIGKLLFNYLSEIALKNGQEKLRLKVFHKNTKAIKFYKKNHFIEAGMEKIDLGQDYTVLDYVMEKNLK